MSRPPGQTDDIRIGSAYHESGHAIVAVRLGYRIKDINLRRIDTESADIYGACGFIVPPSSWGTPDYLTVLQAGLVSELTLRQLRSWDLRPAYSDAQGDIRLMEGRTGGINVTSLARLQSARDRAENLVNLHWRVIEALSEVLLRDEFVGGETAHAIIDP